MWQVKENDNAIYDCFYVEDCEEYLDFIIEDLVYGGYGVKVSDDGRRVYVDNRLIYIVEEQIASTDDTAHTYLFDDEGHEVDVSTEGTIHA